MNKHRKSIRNYILHHILIVFKYKCMPYRCRRARSQASSTKPDTSWSARAQPWFCGWPSSQCSSSQLKSESECSPWQQLWPWMQPWHCCACLLLSCTLYSAGRIKIPEMWVKNMYQWNFINVIFLTNTALPAQTKSRDVFACQTKTITRFFPKNKLTARNNTFLKLYARIEMTLTILFRR